ncbi:MAG TPA: HAMP domain-containing sensor histidine kinase [Ktedonobacterales bacterium]
MQPISDADDEAPANELASFDNSAPDRGDSPAGDAGAALSAEQFAAWHDLSALLVKPGNGADALVQSLYLATRLVPNVAEWRLYALTETPSVGLELVAALGGTDDAAEGSRQHNTLGFGSAVDQQVLTQRQPTTVTRAALAHRDTPTDHPSASSDGMAIPLVGADGVLRGVLVGLARPGVALNARDRLLLDAVAHHACVLLAQRADRGAQVESPTPQAEPDERMAFISLAAHELRSPLTTVKGYAQLLLRSARKDPDYPSSRLRALRSIERQASRMSDMVAELLDASRIQRGTFELHLTLVELQPLAQRVVEQQRGTLDEQHELRLEMAATPLAGPWDRARVEQVIRDLLDNALRFSPGGGALTMQIAPAGRMARVTVMDSGIGVPDDERRHLYEPFFRGELARTRNLAGLGLGLYVSRAIVERLGGRLWLVASATQEQRHGSTFAFELPLANPDDA